MRMFVLVAALLLGVGIGGLATADSRGDAGAMKTLNNFVTELLCVPSIESDSEEFTFVTSRTGWVFVALQGQEGSPKAVLDSRQDALVWRVHPVTKAAEAMQWLAEGGHRLRVESAKGMRLDVRAIPEIAFCYYPDFPHIAVYGPYNWAYAERYVLSDVNTLITRSELKPEEFNQWVREGRKWVSNAGLLGLGSAKAPSADEVYQTWATNVGMTQAGFGGIMVDEFGGSPAEHYRAWGEAVRRLHDNSSFAGRSFYAWCGNLFDEKPSLDFSRLLADAASADCGYRFSWEKYLREEPSQEKAEALIRDDLLRDLKAWQAAMPGIERHMVMCLGYLSAPPESLNLNPGVDYHVFMDMQFHFLATEPAFDGLFGIMEYMAAYADEESLRYAQKLLRHYCIEGNRERFNNDPYLLPHLKNPDFADGLNEWRVEPGEEGTIAGKNMKGFSWLQGRYPETRQGDTFCLMKRSAKGPNRVSQTLRSLTPGRLYSLKLLSANLQQLDQNQRTTLSFEFKDAEIEKGFDFQFVVPSCYSHEVKPYTKDHPAHFSWHRLVFRPTKDTAELTISDWAADDAPGGALGAETAFNFVEVQAFVEP